MHEIFAVDVAADSGYSLPIKWGGHPLGEGRIVMKRTSQWSWLALVIGVLATSSGCCMMDQYHDDEYEHCAQYRRIEQLPDSPNRVPASRVASSGSTVDSNSNNR